MTILDNYAPVRENGNGVKLDFDFSFKIFSAGDLVVHKVDDVTNVKTLQVITTDYTVDIDLVNGLC